MNYELAKELKDAGFPQLPRSDARDVYFKGVKIPFGNIRIAQYENGHTIHYLEEIVIIPTLSELIEACLMPRGESDGRYSFYLERRFIENDGTLEALWRASLDQAWAVVENDLDVVSGFGPTPDAAVARLWLALNKK